MKFFSIPREDTSSWIAVFTLPTSFVCLALTPFAKSDFYIYVDGLGSKHKFIKLKENKSVSYYVIKYNKKGNGNMNNVKIFACPTAEEFANEICDYLKIEQGKIHHQKFHQIFCAIKNPIPSFLTPKVRCLFL